MLLPESHFDDHVVHGGPFVPGSALERCDVFERVCYDIRDLVIALLPNAGLHFLQNFFCYFFHVHQPIDLLLNHFFCLAVGDAWVILRQELADKRLAQLRLPFWIDGPWASTKPSCHFAFTLPD